MKKDEINKEVIPFGAQGLRLKDGFVVGYELEHSEILYIGHESEVIADEEGNDVEQVRAFAFEVPRPVTRARAIDAAERAAYNLRSADDVASFNAALARKSRLGVDTDEVAAHDEFIVWVKSELTRIGIK